MSGCRTRELRPIAAEAEASGQARLKAEIVGRARAAGFDIVRVAAPALAAEVSRGLDVYLEAGHHGDMDWLARNADRRRDPATLWPEARSVIVLGASYAPDEDPLAALEHRDRGAISVYARGPDYHDTLKKRLKQIGRWLHQETGAELKVFVDTAPVMEKPLAQAAGLGWQGKHTNLVSREFGSWLFLAEIFTTLALPFDTPERDRCGSCRRCQDVCPTAAFPKPYTLDARRCISYLTIEHKGPIAAEFRAAIGNRIYGCDDCLAVCPWNKFAQAAQDLAFQPRESLRGPLLAELTELDDAAFRAAFAGSPIKRIGRDRFVRNVLIAIGNSGEPSLSPSAEQRLTDTSALVRGIAVWALARLDRARLGAAARLRELESDPDVLAEWDAAMADAA